MSFVGSGLRNSPLHTLKRKEGRPKPTQRSQTAAPLFNNGRHVNPHRTKPARAAIPRDDKNIWMGYVPVPFRRGAAYNVLERDEDYTTLDTNVGAVLVRAKTLERFFFVLDLN